ncbi:transmembrane protein [Tripterygium wilfordii]|uniref:Transmembrane protein n=1 Tax=Tripterygium wilfordii TaxID=458696 RepID=A0A7J7DS23_TRIWF|nr:transmembrane protein [Tripterygium wilfordii]
MLTLNLGADSSVTLSWPIFSASIFVLVALVLSMYLIFEHLAAYNQPEEQKFLIGLILMVPVYALESFLSLLDSGSAFNWEAIRDCYEAFALYCFERYLIACLGGEESTIDFMESQTLIDSSTPLLKDSYAYGEVEHPFPLNCLLRNWNLGADFYHAVKIGIVQYMGVAAVVHLYVFPAVPYKKGDRCVRNVAVLSDYASLGTPPDPEEVRDCERTTRVRLARHDETEKRLNFPQSVRDVVLGSGEIIVDDMKYTVSHVVEPVERGLAKINKTIHQISENVKRHEEQRKSTKDDSFLIPLNSWSREFSELNDNLNEGSISDSGLANGNRQHYHPKGTASLRRSGR